jgi:hypothetical protein
MALRLADVTSATSVRMRLQSLGWLGKSAIHLGGQRRASALAGGEVDDVHLFLRQEDQGLRSVEKIEIVLLDDLGPSLGPNDLQDVASYPIRCRS